MSTTVIETMVKMLEMLPETAQHQVVEHLREYLEEIQDEILWDKMYEKTQTQLVAAARRAKQEIAKGQAMPMDLSRL